MADSTALVKALVVQTQEEERYRLARLLQDGPAQLLVNAALEVETCLRLMDEQPAAARQGLTALLRELRQGARDARALVAALQPPLLRELGLVASLEKFVADFSERTGIDVTLEGWDALTERFPATMESAIFRIVQESLENVRDHARARHVEVQLALTSERLTLTISDDGQGFADAAPPDLESAGRSGKPKARPGKGDAVQGILPERRLGLVAMRDRAELLGGTLQVFSEPGHGVRVVLTAPLRMQVASNEGEVVLRGEL